MIEKKQNHHLRKAAGHNSVSPYYCGSGSNFLCKDIWKVSMIKWERTKNVGNDWKNQNHHLRKAAGHNSVSPYYCGTGCNFLWRDIGKFQWWEIKSKKKL